MFRAATNISKVEKKLSIWKAFLLFSDLYVYRIAKERARRMMIMIIMHNFVSI
jgi:hypothetical protein